MEAFLILTQWSTEQTASKNGIVNEKSTLNPERSESAKEKM